jgi:hypothetical protein
MNAEHQNCRRWCQAFKRDLEADPDPHWSPWERWPDVYEQKLCRRQPAHQFKQNWPRSLNVEEDGSVIEASFV